MNLTKKIAVSFVALLLCLMPFVEQSNAQSVSNAATIALSLNVGQSLSVLATPAAITFTVDGTGKNATASGAISVTTSWNLSASAQVTTDAYFTGASGVALQGANVPANRINVASVFASVDGATATACTVDDHAAVTAATLGQACPSVFTGMTAHQPVNGVGTSTDTLLLSIKSNTIIPADAYTGVLTISAQAN